MREWREREGERESEREKERRGAGDRESVTVGYIHMSLLARAGLAGRSREWHPTLGGFPARYRISRHIPVRHAHVQLPGAGSRLRAFIVGADGCQHCTCVHMYACIVCDRL